MLPHLPSRQKLVTRPISPILVNADTPFPDAPRVTLSFDGSCRPNPGPMGIGYVLLTEESRILARVGAQIGQGTNNEAEYQALLGGLRHALRLGFWNLAIFSDSKLVVEQMEGRWDVKDKRLAKLHREADLLRTLFIRFSLIHTYREFNAEADGLSRQMVFEEPALPLLPSIRHQRYPRTLHDWQAAAIRVWSLKYHPGSGTLSRIFGVPSAQVEQIAYGQTYKDATFAGYPWSQPILT